MDERTLILPWRYLCNWRLATCFFVISDDLRACDVRGARIGSGEQWMSRLPLFVDAPPLVDWLTIWAPLPHQDFSFYQSAKVTCCMTSSRGSHHGHVSVTATRYAPILRQDKTARQAWKAWKACPHMFDIRLCRPSSMHPRLHAFMSAPCRSSPSSDTHRWTTQQIPLRRHHTILFPCLSRALETTTRYHTSAILTSPVSFGYSLSLVSELPLNPVY